MPKLKTLNLAAPENSACRRRSSTRATFRDCPGWPRIRSAFEPGVRHRHRPSADRRAADRRLRRAPARQRRTAAPAQPRPMRSIVLIPVRAAVVEPRDMPVRIDEIGTVEPLATVSVKSRIDGLVVHVGFDEGDYVQAGDVLFKLDDRTWRAQLAQAQANLARDRAQLADAQRILSRNEALAERGFAARAILDTARATVASLEAARRPTPRRSTTSAPSSTTPSSARRSPGAPARKRSSLAPTSRPTTRRRLSSSIRLDLSPSSSRCRRRSYRHCAQLRRSERFRCRLRCAAAAPSCATRFADLYRQRRQSGQWHDRAQGDPRERGRGAMARPVRRRIRSGEDRAGRSQRCRRAPF